MAQRRMFSKSITNSSQFLMMPSSSQNLYFHLGMNADDDGFCEHFALMRMTDSKPDDLRILQAKGFVNVFDDKVLVITDWKENNYLRADRYSPSKYLEIYKNDLNGLSSGIPMVDTGKDRLGKVRIDKDSEEQTEVAIAPTQFPEDIIYSKIETIIQKTGLPEERVKLELKKFISYWTEKSPSGKKERWQKEKVFDPARRLSTWFGNIKEKQQSNKYQSTKIY